MKFNNSRKISLIRKPTLKDTEIRETERPQSQGISIQPPLIPHPPPLEITKLNNRSGGTKKNDKKTACIEAKKI